jgi:hypothetical protein
VRGHFLVEKKKPTEKMERRKRLILIGSQAITDFRIEIMKSLHDVKKPGNA